MKIRFVVLLIALAFVIGFGAAYWLTGWQVRAAHGAQDLAMDAAARAYTAVDKCQQELTSKPAWRLPR